MTLRTFALVAGVGAVALGAAWWSGRRAAAPVRETLTADADAREVARWRAAQERRRAVATTRRTTTTTTRPSGLRIVRVEETERRELENTATTAAGEHVAQSETRTTAERRPEGTPARFRVSLGATWARPVAAPSAVELAAEVRTLGPVWLGVAVEAPPDNPTRAAVKVRAAVAW